MATQDLYRGTGPGPITADGCAVDFYATLSAAGEPERIHAWIPAGATILELGAGTGRITHGLLALGHDVVAVDQSPEMLEHIRGAETVCSPIETLALGRTFDVVLLMSFIVDVADDDLRAAFLRTCRRHVADEGCVIIQRKPPEWYDTIEANERTTADGTTYRLSDLRWPAPGILSATMEYTVGERCWTHTFVSQRLEDADLVAALERAGLTTSGFLVDDREWVRARPAP